MEGTVVAVDASVWLHKGAYACAKELVLGQPTNSYVNFFMTSIECLLRNGVTPLVVFDGRRTLPAKAAEAEERKRKRILAKATAESASDPQTARSAYTQAVEITPAMVDRVIEVVYKWDRTTMSGQLIKQTSLQRSFRDIKDFNFDKFRCICILAGCDYLKSIPGIGIRMAARFVKAVGHRDIIQSISPLSEEPILDLKRTWVSPQMLDTTDQSDLTYKCPDSPDHSSAEGSTPDSSPERAYGLRSRPATQATVIDLGNTIKWSPPCFPVLSLTFIQATVSVNSQLKPSLFRASDHRILLHTTPFDIVVRESCTITVENIEQFVVWGWDFVYLLSTSNEDILSQASQSTMSSTCTVLESDYISETDSEPDLDVCEEESDLEEDSLDPQELPFKVMGPTYYRRRQEVLEEAHEAMIVNNRTPKADLAPEPDNTFDPSAIAVRIYTDNGAEKVGYIQKELTQYIHPLINTNRLGGVRIGKIAFRVDWYLPGFYIKLMITKLGKWDSAVLKKSFRVK
uniref:Exonuclease 1 n=1 Tax=Branchiostoma floridae TaxID=7739 RepID=C3YNB6_BRAFL|eukprot:XP_002602210.1 hypothetical protein BRAFLDRAFT_76899 [Branchiostoma floridae]